MSKVKDFFKGWSKFELCWLVLSTVIMIVLSIIWGDNTLALISGITGILGVVLAAKGKVSTYFFATINVAIYSYLTFNNHLYGEFMLNAFYYIPMNFIGFYLWSRHKDEKSGEVEGKALTPKQIVILLAATAVIVIIYWQILTHLGGQLALIDAMSTVFSVIALIMQVARYAEQWLLYKKRVCFLCKLLFINYYYSKKTLNNYRILFLCTLLLFHAILNLLLLH